jgi:hypothetical protein
MRTKPPPVLAGILFPTASVGAAAPVIGLLPAGNAGGTLVAAGE